MTANTSKWQKEKEKCKRACESKYALEQLFNDNPKRKSTYTLHKNRSFTDSLESNQNGASKELTILRWNKRVPTKEVVIHFLTELSANDIKNFRTKIFRYVKEHGIEAVASIELTRGVDDNPNNRVHFHILTDAKGSKERIRKLFNTACKRSGLVWKEDFRIGCRKLKNGLRYFRYFTKYGYEDKVILFRKGTGLQKFYQIGKWFHKRKELIWEDVKAWLQKKHGTDVEKSKTPDYDDDPDENGNEDTERSYSEDVPTGCNVWTMWCKYPDDTFEGACARFDKHIADKDMASSSKPTTMPKWCRPSTGRITYKQRNRQLRFNNLHANKSGVINMNDKTIYNVTTHSNSTGEIMQEPTKQPLTSTKWCDNTYIFGKRPPVFKALPEHADRTNTPLKLKASLKLIKKYKAAKINMKGHKRRIGRADEYKFLEGIARGVLEDYLHLGQLYGIDEIEQVVRDELKPLSLPDSLFAIIKQTYQRHPAIKSEQHATSTDAIPEQSPKCYNADDVDTKELALSEIEEQDMTNKSKKKSIKPAKQVDIPKVKLVKEFRELFPPNTLEKKEDLTKSILERGVREPLVVWKEENILIDGYHRYDICKEHKIPYKVRLISFKNKEEAKLWMWDNQIRRELVTTLFQRIEIVLQFKAAIAERAKANQRAAGGAVPTKLEEAVAVDTYKILGGMSGTSHGTVRKAEWIRDNYKNGVVSEEDITALRGNKAKISSIYAKYNPPTTPKSSATKPDGKDIPVEQQSGAVSSKTTRPKTDRKTPQKLKKDVKGIIDLLASIENDFLQEEDRMYIYETMSEWAGRKMTELEESKE